jgi:hypothetical protein
MRFTPSSLPRGIKSALPLTLLIIFVLNIFASPSFAQEVFDWYQWRGPDRNGISKETNWNPKFPDGGPKVLWEKQITGFSPVETPARRTARTTRILSTV